MAEAVRQALIASLFPSGGSEKLLVHVKTYQDISHSSSASEEMKGTPRYLCLTQKKSAIRLLKVKKNHNGNFHISKTWSLNDIRQIEIANSHSFSITLNKTYLLYVEKVKEKMIFLAFLIDCCKRSANHMPKLVNIDQSRILMYLADPAAPTLGSSSFYDKSASSSRNSLPQRSSTTLVSANSLHSPLEPVKEVPATPNSPFVSYQKNSELSTTASPSSAPSRPIHREFSPTPRKQNPASSQNPFYQRTPLREDSNKYSLEDDDDTNDMKNSTQRKSSSSMIATTNRNGTPRAVTHSWSAYKPARSSSSSTFNNRMEEQTPRRSLDNYYQKGFSTKDNMIKAQPIRRSIDGWQPERKNPQDGPFSFNNGRRSLDQGSKTSQRRESDEKVQDQPSDHQNAVKRGLPERTTEPTENRPIMPDVNRSTASFFKGKTYEPPSPSSATSMISDKSNSFYDEPDSYSSSGSPPSHTLGREKSPLYTSDRRGSRNEINTFDNIDPYNPAIRRSIDSGWKSPTTSFKKDSFDTNTSSFRKDSYDMRYNVSSPTPLRKSIDGWQGSTKQEFSDPNSRVTKERNSANGSTRSLERVESPIRRSIDHWQSPFTKQTPSNTGPRSISRNSNPFESKRSSMDSWKSSPTQKEEAVSKQDATTMKRAVSPIITGNNGWKSSLKTEDVENTKQKGTSVKDRTPSKEMQGLEKPLETTSDSPLRKQLPPVEAISTIPARRVPNKIKQQQEKEEPNVHNKMDTSKRPVRLNLDIEQKEIRQSALEAEETLLDKKQTVKKEYQDSIEDTDHYLKNILTHIDKSIAELESMESWLALYGTKNTVESV